MAHAEELVFQSALIGIGATAIMDVWLAALKRLNVPTLNFGLLGRWIGYIPQRQWFHQSIAKSAPVKHEVVIGWVAHYTIGICFAGLLAMLAGPSWIHSPTLLPAIATGLATATAPLFVMQPAMGSGVASSRTSAPVSNCMKSVLNHVVFGCGLYVAAITLAHLS